MRLASFVIVLAVGGGLVFAGCGGGDVSLGNGNDGGGSSSGSGGSSGGSSGQGSSSGLGSSSGQGSSSGSSSGQGSSSGSSSGKGGSSGGLVDGGCTPLPQGQSFQCINGNCNDSSTQFCEQSNQGGCMSIPKACMCQQTFDCTCLLANVSNFCAQNQKMVCNSNGTAFYLSCQ